jgi:hypothetical protein
VIVFATENMNAKAALLPSSYCVWCGVVGNVSCECIAIEEERGEERKKKDERRKK